MFYFAASWASCKLYHSIFPIHFWIVFDQPVVTQKHVCSIIIASSCFLCLLISISRGATLVTSPLFILSVLKTLNEKFINLVYICFSLTSCSSIPICVYPESTSALILRFLLFFVFTFACIFNSLSILLCQFGITYLF